jgi:phosphatidylglycerophosphatase A
MNITPTEKVEVIEPAYSVKRLPSVKFMLEHPSHFFALGLGSGLSPIMPGTAGTLFGWLCFDLLTDQWPAVFNVANAAWFDAIGLIGTDAKP